MNILNKTFPKYNVKLTNNKKVCFRPFTVKEEHSLLIAKESKNNFNILKTLIDVMTVCYGENVEDYSIADFELAFLHLRSKSIGEIENAKIKCPETKEEVFVSINLVEDAKVKGEIQSQTIDLNDIKIKLKKLTIKDLLENANYNKSFDDRLSFISNNIISIQKDDELIKGEDLSTKEKIKFIENLSSKDFKKLVNYYDNSPSVYFLLNYKRKDNSENTLQLSGVFSIIAFFLTI